MSANLDGNGIAPTKSKMDFGCASCKYTVQLCQTNLDMVELLPLRCKTQECKEEARKIIDILEHNEADAVCNMFGYCMDPKHGPKMGQPPQLSQSNRQLEANVSKSNLSLASGLDNWATYENSFVCNQCINAILSMKNGLQSVEGWTREICVFSECTKVECDKHVDTAIELINTRFAFPICQQWRLCTSSGLSE